MLLRILPLCESCREIGKQGCRAAVSSQPAARFRLRPMRAQGLISADPQGVAPAGEKLVAQVPARHAAQSQLKRPGQNQGARSLP